MKQKSKILIIEDEIPAVKRLKSLINKYMVDAEILEDLDSVETSILWFEKHEQPDLIFMDIQLADGQSFDIFEHVEVTAPVIFITAYNDYAIKAFDVNGLDYLLKPIDVDRFQTAVSRFTKLQKFSKPNQPNYTNLLEQLRQKDNYKSRFLIKQGEQFSIVQVENIAFFQFIDGYTHLFTYENKKFIIDESIEQLSKILSPNHFFQVNRKTILNIKSIDKIVSWFNSRLKVTTKPVAPDEIVVSRDRVKGFKGFLEGE